MATLLRLSLPDSRVSTTDMAITAASTVNRLHAGFIPPIALDFTSETPLYRQISVWFQRAILAGKLQPGQRVPSTRALAKELRISRIPVLGAYELLIAEGYFEPFVGAGTCVSHSIPDAMYRSGGDGAASTTAVAPESGPTRAISRRASGMDGRAQAWLDRCRGCTDLEHFPVGIWTKLVNRHARKISRSTMGYGDAMGYGAFREAVAQYLGAFRAVKCDPSQILITTGAQQGLLICALTLLDPDDAAWIEEPGYPAAYQALRAAGAQLVPVPADGDGLDVSRGIRMANAARAAFVTPSHQFPLGSTMSAARRIELLSWAAHNGAWIVEDDYDSEYRFSGNPIASLQGLDTDGRVIYLGTLTKVMFPALRLGFLVIPKDLVPCFLNVRNANDTHSTSVLYQMAMTDFIREGHFSRHIRRMRAVYAERRKALAAAIRARAAGVLEVIGDDAGMGLVALLPTGVDDVKVVTQARQMGIPVNALSECYMSPPERGGLMLGYGYLNGGVQAAASTVSALKAIIDAQAVRRLRGSAA
jgi:GntR family transcriptional regulator/MocR family aminotransferase